MSLTKIISNFALVAILGCLAIGMIEASPFNHPELSPSNYEALQSLANNPALLNTLRQANSADSEDDEDDDEASLDSLGAAVQQQASNPLYNYQDGVHQTPQESQYQATSPVSSDLKVAASHHHHGHGAKGWLDMGAWTGKKGSFGWHDKHPVGKKGRR